MAHRLTPALAFLLLTVSACRGPGESPEQSLRSSNSSVGGSVNGEVTPASPLGGKRRWTSSFEERRLLLADDVFIEGPPGLLEHVATRLDPETHTEEVKTTKDGLRQTYGVRPAFASQAEPIACFLDELEAHALRRLQVLERPAPVPVRIIARGDVYVKNFATGEESRGATLALEGKLDLEESPKPVGAPPESP